MRASPVHPLAGGRCSTHPVRCASAATPQPLDAQPPVPPRYTQTRVSERARLGGRFLGGDRVRRTPLALVSPHTIQTPSPTPSCPEDVRALRPHEGRPLTGYGVHNRFTRGGGGRRGSGRCGVGDGVGARRSARVGDRAGLVGAEADRGRAAAAGRLSAAAGAGVGGGAGGYRLTASVRIWYVSVRPQDVHRLRGATGRGGMGGGGRGGRPLVSQRALCAAAAGGRPGRAELHAGPGHGDATAVRAGGRRDVAGVWGGVHRCSGQRGRAGGACLAHHRMRRLCVASAADGAAGCAAQYLVHGHVVLADPAPVLFYPISSTEVRCLVDVPLAARSAGASAGCATAGARGGHRPRRLQAHAQPRDAGAAGVPARRPPAGRLVQHAAPADGRRHDGGAVGCAPHSRRLAQRPGSGGRCDGHAQTAGVLLAAQATQLHHQHPGGRIVRGDVCDGRSGAEGDALGLLRLPRFRRAAFHGPDGDAGRPAAVAVPARGALFRGGRVRHRSGAAAAADASQDRTGVEVVLRGVQHCEAAHRRGTRHPAGVRPGGPHSYRVRSPGARRRGRRRGSGGVVAVAIEGAVAANVMRTQMKHPAEPSASSTIAPRQWPTLPCTRTGCCR
eukprot:ctg_314.g120